MLFRQPRKAGDHTKALRVRLGLRAAPSDPPRCAAIVAPLEFSYVLAA